MTAPLTNHPIRAGLKNWLDSKHHPRHTESRREPKRPIGVMKFGGTSVGDASCIARVVEIIRAASQQSGLVVVVSAMSGVTNRLIEAAMHAEAGDYASAAAIFERIRQQHAAAIEALVHSPEERSRIQRKMDDLLQEGDRLCRGAVLLRELTLHSRDAIASLGERLCAPIVAGALAQRGIASEAIEATEVLITDSCHGAADPFMDLTRERCESRLRPLLERRIVPVVTGFIGATPEGTLTTLGRGGSDYSATILGAALDVDDVVIWTDVDGLQTVDPRLVPGGSTIPEISYREAAELAYFGAKVLHPKTLRALAESGIPLWIRNTFAPELHGTKITPEGLPGGVRMTALTAISDVALITLGGPGMVGVQDVLGRTVRTAAALRADVLLISQSSSQNDVCLVIASSYAKATVEALRHEFAHDLAHESAEHITVDPTVAIVAVVGSHVRGRSRFVGRTFRALDSHDVGVIAIAQGSTECSLSFVVAKEDMKAALLCIHREFQLGNPSNESAAEAESYLVPCVSAEDSRLLDHKL
ncbi:MAG: aspartate kinase [Candidatus Sulfotelmatobacter sp.]